MITVCVCAVVFICFVEMCLILSLIYLSVRYSYLFASINPAGCSFFLSGCSLAVCGYCVVTRNHLVFTILDFVSNFALCNNFEPSQPFDAIRYLCSSIYKCLFGCMCSRCNLRFFLIDLEKRELKTTKQIAGRFILNNS